LSVNSTGDGTRGYSATVFALQGQVPAGKNLVSPDDATLDCCVLSRWEDGSASVLVAAGNSNVGKGSSGTIGLQLGTAAAGLPPLTVSQVGLMVKAVQADFGVLGVVTLSDFGKPDRIWWANAQVICARYRLRAPNHATLEAVVDIHAYAGGSAFVEVVIENALVDSTLLQPIKPADASYSGTIAVNGNAIGSASSTGSADATHTAFRAWYACTWVGGNPGLYVSQTAADLQKHPLLFKCDQPASDLSGYAADTYTPWATGRHRGQGMGGPGDHPSIGPLTLWDAAFLQSASPAAANAVEANALCALSFNVCYRDTTTGLVPDASQLVYQSQQAYWPKTTNAGDVALWEVAHHPGVGLMAFAARPSPVHLETAQRIASCNATWSAGGDGSANLYMASATGLADGTGVFGYYYQPRGRAWCLRSLVHATFLSPDGSNWRTGGKYWINLNRIYWDQWRTKQPASALSLPWAVGPNHLDNLPQNQWPWPAWQTHFGIPEWHKAASAQLLSGTQQTALESLANWVAEYPVRWINEQPNGGWRYIPYQQLIPADANGQVPTTWGAVMAQIVTAPPPTVAGGWNMTTGNSTEYANFFGEGLAGGGSSNGYYYCSVYWAALVAAVERGIPGSAQAWATSQANLIGLEIWRKGFAGNPRFGSVPRNV
jgi:hypothetical protein